MSNLRDALTEVADDFVARILETIRTASLMDIVGEGAEPARAPAARSSAAAAPARGRAPRQAKSAAASKAAPAKQAASGKRHRASADEVSEQKTIALAAAKELPEGFSKGDVMKKSGSKVDLGRALGLLVADGVLTRKGERRNTRYWVN